MTNKYIKKPVEIEAIQWNGNNADEILDFVSSSNRVVDKINNTFMIKTLEGMMTANIGDYIIKGIKGEFYPCKPDIFECTYILKSDKPQTNYDKIIHMTLEELLDSAIWCNYCQEMRKLGKCVDYVDCRECRKAWLKRDAH